MRHTCWSQAEIDYLKLNYSHTNNWELCSELFKISGGERSFLSYNVKQKANQMGLRKDPKNDYQKNRRSENTGRYINLQHQKKAYAKQHYAKWVSNEKFTKEY